MFAVIVEIDLAVVIESVVRVKVAAGDHRQVVGIGVMVEVAEIGEAYSFGGKALEEIALDGGVVVLIFQDDDEDVVKMLGLGSGSGCGGALSEAENA